MKHFEFGDLPFIFILILLFYSCTQLLQSIIFQICDCQELPKPNRDLDALSLPLIIRGLFIEYNECLNCIPFPTTSPHLA